MLYPPLPKSYKKRFPFKLATTSYIFPDHIVPNVASLATFFDEIELVLFESEDENNLPDEEQINALLDLSSHHGVSFNIHLPIDIFLGDQDEEVRRKGVSIVKKVIEQTRSLNPSVFTLHFDLRNKNGQDAGDVKAWRSRVTQSAKEIVEYGIEPKRVSIETLGYQFEWIEDIVKAFGYSICLDIGHLLVYGLDLTLYFKKYLSNTSIIHLHGFENGVDHLGIDHVPEPDLRLIFSCLCDYRGIVSLEVFSVDDLKRSLITLEEKWGGK